MVRDPISLILVTLAVLGMGAVLIWVGGRRLDVLAAAMIGLILRLVLGFSQFWTAGISSDALAYDQLAQQVVAWWSGESAEPYQVQGKEGWPYLLALMYRGLGYLPELGILVNVFAGTATILVVAAVCRVLGWEVGLKPAAWIVALWPVSVLWGPLLLREAIVTLLLALSLLGAVLMQKPTRCAGHCPHRCLGHPHMIWMRGGLAFMILVAMPAFVAASIYFARPSTLIYSSPSRLGCSPSW